MYDGSRKIAGDRWQVACIVAVEVPVDYPDAEILSAAGVNRDDLKGIFGDVVVFEKVMERNFIDENESQEDGGRTVSIHVQKPDALSLTAEVSRAVFWSENIGNIKSRRHGSEKPQNDFSLDLYLNI